MIAGRMVALLRGINVGRAKRIAMADLRALVEGLGYHDVSTLLNSGNIIFSAPDATTSEAATNIEAAISAQLGVSSRVTVVTAAELAQIVAQNPLLGIAPDHSRLLVAVLNNPADRSLVEPLAAEDWSPEAFALGTRACYLWCPAGVLDSKPATAMGRVLRDAVTSRNWATILKLHALC